MSPAIDAAIPRCERGRLAQGPTAHQRTRAHFVSFQRDSPSARSVSRSGGRGATQEWKVAVTLLFVHANRRTCSTVRPLGWRALMHIRALAAAAVALVITTAAQADGPPPAPPPPVAVACCEAPLWTGVYLGTHV